MFNEVSIALFERTQEKLVQRTIQPVPMMSPYSYKVSLLAKYNRLYVDNELFNIAINTQSKELMDYIQSHLDEHPASHHRFYLNKGEYVNYLQHSDVRHLLFEQYENRPILFANVKLRLLEEAVFVVTWMSYRPYKPRCRI